MQAAMRQGTGLPYSLRDGYGSKEWYFDFGGMAHGGYATEADARVALERMVREAFVPRRLRLAGAPLSAARADARVTCSKFAAGLAWEHLDEAMNAIAARYAPNSAMRDLLERLGTYMTHQDGDSETVATALDDADKALDRLIAQEHARAAEKGCRA